ncbi:MAG: SAM-dependent methyltransferase [Bacteroidales bacterium]|nr:SAM-dependent methyltransferase [Bacteroidales bacterium]
MDTKQFIAEHLNDDVHDLALKTFNAEVDKALALRQIEARQLLRKKVPSWSNNDELLFPPHLSLEQSSSETTALYKASLLQGNSFLDLTGGLGIDSHFISKKFTITDYVEQNHDLCEFAQHNFKVLQDSIRVHHESAEDYLSHCDTVDVLFLDPARRDTHGRKVVSIADCTPNLMEIQDQLLPKAHQVLVKLSPMLDIHQALKELHGVKEVHVVAVENECKELLFLLEPNYEKEPVFVCVNLQTNQPVLRFLDTEEHDSAARLAREIQSYLYEPNAALMKAGCFKLLTQRYDLLKLHRHSHLYTSSKRIDDFPGRVFEVEGWAPYNKRVKQALLADVSKASIATRNFPLSVAELRKVLKITDGDAVYLFATTIGEGQKIIINAKK